jgi:hypothetical protein
MPRLGPLRRDIVHRVGQAGGGEYRQLLRARNKRREEDTQEQQKAHGIGPR